MGGCEFHDLLAKSQRRENVLQKSIDYADCVNGNIYIIKQEKIQLETPDFFVQNGRDKFEH
jgi:hypothetical protein